MHRSVFKRQDFNQELIKSAFYQTGTDRKTFIVESGESIYFQRIFSLLKLIWLQIKEVLTNFDPADSSVELKQSKFGWKM